MMNTTIFHKMVNDYDATSYTHEYMFGFADRGNIWLTLANASILPYVCTLDSASRNGGYALRFKPNKAQKELLKTGKAYVLCSTKEFNEMVETSKYNRGEIYEKIVTEFFGKEWEKDNVPYTEAGDLEVNGIAYQIKFEKATFVNEKGLARIMAVR